MTIANFSSNFGFSLSLGSQVTTDNFLTYKSVLLLPAFGVLLRVRQMRTPLNAESLRLLYDVTRGAVGVEER